MNSDQWDTMLSLPLSASWIQRIQWWPWGSRKWWNLSMQKAWVLDWLCGESPPAHHLRKMVTWQWINLDHVVSAIINIPCLVSPTQHSLLWLTYPAFPALTYLPSIPCPDLHTQYFPTSDNQDDLDGIQLQTLNCNTLIFIGIRKNTDIHRKLDHQSYDFRDIITWDKGWFNELSQLKTLSKYRTGVKWKW